MIHGCIICARGKITILHGKIYQYSVSEKTTTVDKNPNYAGPVFILTNYTYLSFKYVLFYEDRREKL